MYTQYQLCRWKIQIIAGQNSGSQNKKHHMRSVTHQHLFFPTAGKHGSSISKLMLEWLKDLLRNMSQRTVPIIYTDANTQFGMNEDSSKIGSSSLGECNRGIVNSTGVAIRDVCEQFNMSIATTQQELPPTFYSAAMRGKNTRIDHLIVPMSLQKGLDIRANAWIKSGRKLQLIKSPYLADHMPIVLSMTHLTYIYLRFCPLLIEMPP